VPAVHVETEDVRELTAAVCVTISARYNDIWKVWVRCMSKQSLWVIQRCTGGQCHYWNVLVTWSYRETCNQSCCSVLCTLWWCSGRLGQAGKYYITIVQSTQNEHWNESSCYSLVDIFVRPGSSSFETNYDRRPSFRRRGTSSMERSSSVRHRLPVSWHLQTISQDLFVFTVILEHRTTHYWLCKAPS